MLNLSSSARSKVGVAALALCWFAFSLSSCSKNTGSNKTPLAVEPKRLVETIPSAAPCTEVVATLAQFKPTAAYRRRKEPEWKTPENLLSFCRFDSFRTDAGASAKIELVQGSEIDMGENSLVIIDPLDKLGQPGDRAVLRNGAIAARTKKALWILTSAALVRLVPGKTGTAKANLALQEGKSLRVAVASGEARAFSRPTSGPAVPVKEISAGKAVVLTAAIPPAGWMGEESDWSLAEKATRSLRDASSVPTKGVPTKAIELVLMSPENNSSLRAERTLIKGKVSGQGAEVRVNGKVAAVASDLTFSVPVELGLGVNNVVVELIQPRGEISFKKLTLIRKN